MLLGQHAQPVHWEGMQDRRRPYHLLVLNGDQLYSDEIWGRLKTLRDWNDLSDDDKGKEPGRKVKKKELLAEIEQFHFDLYCRQWAREGIGEVLAGIPAPWDADPDRSSSISDDLADQWMSRGHRVERLRLINRLLAFADQKQCRVTVVSGDVHVGGMAQIEARAGGGPPRDAWTINQLISSPIVHPPLRGLVLFLIEQRLDGAVEQVERGSRDITAQMVKLPTASRYLINARNWLSLTFDYRQRIWAEWFIENPKPAAPAEPFDKLSQVIHPVDFFNKK